MCQSSKSIINNYILFIFFIILYYNKNKINYFMKKGYQCENY